MAELIDRAALLAEYDRVHVGEPGGARALIANASTVDAVPVVRCKDCIGKGTWYKDVNGCDICGMSGLYIVEDNDYCSYGERKDDDA